jgi:hypothetical protein
MRSDLVVWCDTHRPPNAVPLAAVPFGAKPGTTSRSGEALEDFFAPIGWLLAAIFVLGAMILGLYLLLVLIKFLWARA